MKDPKVGGGSEGTCKVTQNQPRHVPRSTACLRTQLSTKMISLCNQNDIQLEEKEKREKELRAKIIQEVEEYKVTFYDKRTLNVDTNKVQNREREK
ncbi:hypothetical protein Lal_00037586, partial [Lupinus albus]